MWGMAGKKRARESVAVCGLCGSFEKFAKLEEARKRWNVAFMQLTRWAYLWGSREGGHFVFCKTRLGSEIGIPHVGSHRILHGLCIACLMKRRGWMWWRGCDLNEKLQLWSALYESGDRAVARCGGIYCNGSGCAEWYALLGLRLLYDISSIGVRIKREGMVQAEWLQPYEGVCEWWGVGGGGVVAVPVPVA